MRKQDLTPTPDFILWKRAFHDLCNLPFGLIVRIVSGMGSPDYKLKEPMYKRGRIQQRAQY